MRMMESLKEKMNNSLKEIQENIIKHVKKMNKTVQDLKMEIEAIKKIQTEAILQMKKLGKKQEQQMQVSATEYKRLKRESQTEKT